jgi:hypothetical protein
VVTGAKDAAIYVGQSADIVVRRSEVHDNVTGIEIENSTNALVEENHAHHNTGGILVFLLPNNPSKVGSDTKVLRNRVVSNAADACHRTQSHRLDSVESFGVHNVDVEFEEFVARFSWLLPLTNRPDERLARINWDTQRGARLRLRQQGAGIGRRRSDCDHRIEHDEDRDGHPSAVCAAHHFANLRHSLSAII